MWRFLKYLEPIGQVDMVVGIAHLVHLICAGSDELSKFAEVRRRCCQAYFC